MKIFRLLPVAAAAFVSGCVHPDEMARQRALQDAVHHCYLERKLYVHGNMEIAGPDIVETGHCLPVFSREQYEALAAKFKDAMTTDFPDHVLIESGDHWQRIYFTKPGHPYYPWAVAAVVVGHGAAPGVKTGEPVNVLNGMALPNGVAVPDNATEDAAILNWVNGVIGEVRTEFKLPPDNAFAIK